MQEKRLILVGIAVKGSIGRLSYFEMCSESLYHSVAGPNSNPVDSIGGDIGLLSFSSCAYVVDFVCNARRVSVQHIFWWIAGRSTPHDSVSFVAFPSASSF